MYILFPHAHTHRHAFYSKVYLKKKKNARLFIPHTLESCTVNAIRVWLTLSSLVRVQCDSGFKMAARTVFSMCVIYLGTQFA